MPRDSEEMEETAGEMEIVDLQAAYLQIRVDERFWKHQLVKFKGKTYCLTRLGFGLNVAPRIMSFNDYYSERSVE